jgi:hypothetical protein
MATNELAENTLVRQHLASLISHHQEDEIVDDTRFEKLLDFLTHYCISKESIQLLVTNGCFSVMEASELFLKIINKSWYRKG